nr:protein IQ-DOMAIN 31 [Tanacetum cinerariifolium]
MDDPNITIDEYIRLKEENARRRIFNDTLTSEAKLSCEPTVSSLNDNKIDFRISFDESNDEGYTIVFDRNSFSYKKISTNDLKTDSENDNDKVDMPSFLSPEPTVSYFDDLDFFKDFENEFPAIVYNDALTSKSDSLTEPVKIPHCIDEFDFKDETSLSECYEEEQNFLNFNDLFPLTTVYMTYSLNEYGVYRYQYDGDHGPKTGPDRIEPNLSKMAARTEMVRSATQPHFLPWNLSILYLYQLANAIYVVLCFKQWRIYGFEVQLVNQGDGFLGHLGSCFLVLNFTHSGRGRSKLLFGEMGKSPGKWMKTLLFGRKSSKSKYHKANDELKKIDAKEVAVLPLNQNGNPNLSVSASQRSGGKIEDILLSDSSQDEVKTSVPDNQDVCTAATPEQDAQKDSDRIREEQAATDLQAALRGYLARHEFRTLKGIIRLQALIRGHLVRRQAISTLYCMFQIVKIQAVARGRKIRHTDIGVEVKKRCTRVVMSSVGVVASSMQTLMLSSNGFARKIISSSTTAIPLHFQYKANDMNSVLSWLKRWSASHCWKVLPKPKEGRRPDLKKSSTRRHSMPNVEIIASEFDKPIRNMRKLSSTEPASIVEEENPELVLERIKRNLRKVNNPVSENTIQTEPETKKESTDNNTQNMATVLFEPEIPREDETVQEVGLMKKETKTPRRKGSLPVNQEYNENNEPPQTKRSLPSYMAATVSAKAKLRNQDFPETTTLNRRYSLPGSAASKISLSPRVQTTGRLKNDRSLQLSRDGSVKRNHVEWRL